MKIKNLKIILSLIVFFSLLLPPESLAFGNLLQTTPSANNDKWSNIKDELQKTKEETKQALDDYRDALEGKKLEMLQKYGLKLIDRRLQDLAKAEEILTGTERLSEENRAEIQNNLDICSSGLTALIAEIQAADDIETLKTLIESIFYDYRVYLVELPQDRGLRAAGWAEYVLAEHSTKVIDKIEAAIEKYKNAGKDTSTVEALLVELQAKIAEIQGYIDSAQENFRAMEPAEDVTPAQAYLEAGLADLQSAKDAVDEAHQIIQNIIAEFKKLLVTEDNQE